MTLNLEAERQRAEDTLTLLAAAQAARDAFQVAETEALTEAPVLDGFQTRLLEDCELEVEKGPDHDLNDLFAALSARNIHVVSLRNKANRLEELFMHLVENKQQRTPA